MSLKRVTVIVNPTAGRGMTPAVCREVEHSLRAHGWQVHLAVTTAAPDSAKHLAILASRNSDQVVCCGGDGTVHGVVQGLAQTSTALGVLPLGTGNALARHLRLPLDAKLAVEKLLTYQSRHIPLGYGETPSGRRWFAVMAGAGPDGTLVRDMQLSTKANAGRRAYYSEAMRLFFTRRFPAFRVTYRPFGSHEWKSRAAVAMMCSRVGNLGGLFAGLTSSSRPDRRCLDVQLLSAPAHLSLPAWITLGKLRAAKLNPWLTSLEVEELRCDPIHPSRSVFTQIDGEPFGQLPLHVHIVPASLHLLMPTEAA